MKMDRRKLKKIRRKLKIEQEIGKIKEKKTQLLNEENSVINPEEISSLNTRRVDLVGGILVIKSKAEKFDKLLFYNLNCKFSETIW